MKTCPLPLFDTIRNLHKNHENVQLADPAHLADFDKILQFLKSYSGSLGTFNSYRRETERLLQWTWHIRKTTLTGLRREDIEDFVRFCQHPPDSWIGLKKMPRFTEGEGVRVPNPLWRPFVAGISKVSRKNGNKVEIRDFSLSQGAISEIFAILGTCFNFLVAEEYLSSNPVAQIRQKSRFLRKTQTTAPVRRLSLLQWQYVLDAAEQMAREDPQMHERTVFILHLLFGLYLRISELASSERWTPSMNDFAKDSQARWWFKTVSKGNKERQVAVSDAVLESLRRWRMFLGLSPLPPSSDNSPLIPKTRGHGPVRDTSLIRRIVQKCFDMACACLRKDGFSEEADNLAVATVHWLRHTGISEDVKFRPREHVRDDAGHSSSQTTDRYIDVELDARHRSARRKALVP